MKKAFINYCKAWDEIKIIDTETEEIKSYTVSKEGYPFGIPYITTIEKMGYKSVTECLKTLKGRHMLGYTINYKEQRESERISIINLGIERIKRSGRVNTLDIEDIIEKLASYGMGYVDAQNVIIESYLHELELAETV